MVGASAFVRHEALRRLSQAGRTILHHARSVLEQAGERSGGQGKASVAWVGQHNKPSVLLPVDNRAMARPSGPEPRARPKLSTSHHLTDLGNAGRLVAKHGADLHYCYAWKRWLVWDGRRWKIDDTGELQRRAKDTVISIYAEAPQIQDAETRKAVARWAQYSESAPRLRAMIQLAESEPGIPITPERLDTDLMLLNVLNGTLDLRTGKLLPHRREQLITKVVPVKYDAKAQSAPWEAFLDQIMHGNKDLIRFLQKATGYALTGDTSEQAIFILYGTGANGKSTFLQTVSAVFGDYARQTPIQTLLARRGNNIPNDVARLDGARLVTAAEAEHGQRLAESLVKQMTGGDRIAARFLHAEWFEFDPTFKIFVATNHRPQIRGTDHAIWRRIHLIPFTKTIPEGRQDKKLADKLRGELPGVLRWAVEGCLAWQRNGLGAPPLVRSATDAYREEMDPLAGFINECCLVDEATQARAGKLYEAYRQWCTASGEEAVSGRDFAQRLIEHGFEKKRDKDGMRYHGLGLLADNGEEEHE